MSSQRQPALWFAVMVVLIDALGFSIIMPIMPDLLVGMTGDTVAGSAIIGGVMMAVYALNQFIFGPVMGALSDRYGRRPLIIFCLATLVIDYVIMALAETVWLLFVGRFLAGIAGASYTVATAYIADISERDKRSENFGLVGAAFGIGFVFGPVIGGFAGAWDVRAPFWVAAALCAAGLAFAVFVLPESLKDENRRAFSLASANPVSSILRAFTLPALGPFLAVYGLLTLSDFTYPAIWAYWGKETFGWSAAMIGLTLTVYGLGTSFVQGVLIRKVVPMLGEPMTVVFGLGAAALSLLLFGLASQTWMVFAIIPVSCLSHVAGVALTGMATRQVSDSEQGELQGVMGSIVAVCSVVSPLIATAIFFRMADDTGPYLPGAPYLVAFVFAMLAYWPLSRALGRYRTAG
jgi:DHA1 family tetracycline resistance protein-like MFS transporter